MTLRWVSQFSDIHYVHIYKLYLPIPLTSASGFHIWIENDLKRKILNLYFFFMIQKKPSEKKNRSFSVLWGSKWNNKNDLQFNKVCPPRFDIGNPVIMPHWFLKHFSLKFSDYYIIRMRFSLILRLKFIPWASRLIQLDMLCCATWRSNTSELELCDILGWFWIKVNITCMG